MAGCGRRFAFRVGAAGFAAGLGFFVSGVGTLAAANPLQMTVQVGYHDTFKLGEWMPVTVDISNSGPQLDGTLEIATSNSAAGKGGPPAGSAVYQTPLTLAPGASKHFRTYVLEDVSGAVQARVVQGGRVVASQEGTIASTVAGLLVGVLSDEPSALDGIATIHPGGVAPTVIHLAGGELPDSGLQLRAFDMLAIDDFSTDTLTAGQRNALVDYVMQGGSLLLGTGGSWHKTLAGLPTAIVPIQVNGSAVLATSSALGGLTGIEVATGSVSSGAGTWLSDGDSPLFVEAPVGAGLVEMSTFDWAQGPVTTWAGATTLLRHVVVRSTYGSITNPSNINMTMSKGGFTNSVAARGGALSQALGNVPALELPAWWLIGTLVLVYVLLVGPVNYLVLRALGRRALAWITVPTIALVASGGAYGASVVTKGTSVVANEISIVHVEQGWDRAYNEGYTGIVAPTRGDYEVGLGGRPVMTSPIFYYYSPNLGDPNLATMRVDTATGDVTLPGMSAFTLRGFATEAIVAAPMVTGSAKLTGGQLTGTIKNVSSVDFSDGVVFSGSAYQKLGALTPGASASFSLQPATTTIFNGNPIFAQVYPSSYCCGGTTSSGSAVERENETRTAVLSTLSINNFANLPVSASPMIVLWTKQPFEHVSVNGGHPRTYIESAIVLTLPIAQIGTGALPSGFVGGRLVDLDASLNPAGPPGLMIASGGSMTYSFTPSLAAGTHLTNVVLNTANPYGPKFALGPNGQAAVKGQVWDWSTSSWVDVSYQDGSTTSVPDAAVNPATGEVRLKLNSDGQYTAGFLTISGTVQ